MWRRVVGIVVVVAALVVGGVRLAKPPQAAVVQASLLETPDQTDYSQFARADRPRKFSFPADHGPHPEYLSEWWYYTGNLEAESGEHLGFQLTFFRRALDRQPVARASDWGLQQVYMAHFAVTNAGDGSYRAFERFSRGAAGLAGAQAEPYRVWLENWSAEQVGADVNTVRLQAEQGSGAETVKLGITLHAEKPPALQGDQGLSQKTPDAGNASYYYSMTRMVSQGTITLGTRTYRVNGLTWMDREFGTTALGKDDVGWDWFAIQLDNNRELMLYQIRKADGSTEAISEGSLVEADGSVKRIPMGQVQITVTASWQSPRTQARYPAGWKISVPSVDLALELQPYVANQELPFQIPYWEGAITIRGTFQGQAVSGSGYAELTGYAGAMQNRV